MDAMQDIFYMDYVEKYRVSEEPPGSVTLEYDFKGGFQNHCLSVGMSLFFFCAGIIALINPTPPQLGFFVVGLILVVPSVYLMGFLLNKFFFFRSIQCKIILDKDSIYIEQAIPRIHRKTWLSLPLSDVTLVNTSRAPLVGDYFHEGALRIDSRTPVEATTSDGEHEMVHVTVPSNVLVIIRSGNSDLFADFIGELAPHVATSGFSAMPVRQKNWLKTKTYRNAETSRAPKMEFHMKNPFYMDRVEQYRVSNQTPASISFEYDFKGGLFLTAISLFLIFITFFCVILILVAQYRVGIIYCIAVGLLSIPLFMIVARKFVLNTIICRKITLDENSIYIEQTIPRIHQKKWLSISLQDVTFRERYGISFYRAPKECVLDIHSTLPPEVSSSDKDNIVSHAALPSKSLVIFRSENNQTYLRFISKLGLYINNSSPSSMPVHREILVKPDRGLNLKNNMRVPISTSNPGVVNQNYQGIELFQDEQAVLVELEKTLGQVIPYVGRVDWTTFGFSAESGHVTGLGLFNMNLKSVPASIGALKHVKILVLSCNKISYLPSTIGQLASLERLNLFLNKLSSLPETIGELKSLFSLGLRGNQLTSLPETMVQVTSLRHLDLNGNRLKFLSKPLKEWIKDLKNHGCKVIK